MNVLITHRANTKIYGVYDNAGTWTQADADNFPEKVAYLDELPDNNGTYSATLYDDTDTVEFEIVVIRVVPYVNGVPVVSSVAGYTKQSSHPAGQNNMAWGFIKIDLDIMDKSNATYWKASVRALDSYDSDNPKFHLTTELTQDFFDTHLEDDFKKIVFICDNSVKSQNLLIYSENQEGIALARIEKWMNTKGMRGL
jgi:hypothetical protein